MRGRGPIRSGRIWFWIPGRQALRPSRCCAGVGSERGNIGRMWVGRNAQVGHQESQVGPCPKNWSRSKFPTGGIGFLSMSGRTTTPAVSDPTIRPRPTVENGAGLPRLAPSRGSGATCSHRVAERRRGRGGGLESAVRRAAWHDPAGRGTFRECRHPAKNSGVVRCSERAREGGQRRGSEHVRAQHGSANTHTGVLSQAPEC